MRILTRTARRETMANFLEHHDKLQRDLGRRLFWLFRSFRRRGLRSRSIHTLAFTACAVCFYLMLRAHHIKFLEGPWGEVARVLASILAYLFLYVPLALSWHHEQTRSSSSRALGTLLCQADLTLPSDWTAIEVGDIGQRRIQASIKEAVGGELFLFSPNGFHLCADRFERELREAFKLRQPEEREAVESAIRCAQGLRDALDSFKGSIWVFLPDPEEPDVASELHVRGNSTGIPGGLLADIARRACKEVGSLKRARSIRDKSEHRLRTTRLRHLPFLPDRRILLVGSSCFRQVHPPSALGLTQPVTELTRDGARSGLESLELAFRTMAELL